MKPKDKRKPETIIADLRRRLKYWQDVARDHAANLTQTIMERDTFRASATKAEAEAAEWKRRFDALLAAILELRKAQP